MWYSLVPESHGSQCAIDHLVLQPEVWRRAPLVLALSTCNVVVQTTHVVIGHVDLADWTVQSSLVQVEALDHGLGLSFRLQVQPRIVAKQLLQPTRWNDASQPALLTQRAGDVVVADEGGRKRASKRRLQQQLLVEVPIAVLVGKEPLVAHRLRLAGACRLWNDILGRRLDLVRGQVGRLAVAAARPVRLAVFVGLCHIAAEHDAVAAVEVRVQHAVPRPVVVGGAVLVLLEGAVGELDARRDARHVSVRAGSIALAARLIAAAAIVALAIAVIATARTSQSSESQVRRMRAQVRD